MIDTIFMILVPVAIVAVFVGIAVRSARMRRVASTPKRVRWVVPVEKKPEEESDDSYDPLMENDAPRGDEQH